MRATPYGTVRTGSPCLLPPVCVLASPALMPNLPPARLRWSAFILQCGRVNLRERQSSAVQDESFAIRDGQFNYPHIRILRSAPIQIVPKFHFIINILDFRSGPFPAAIQLRHPFMKYAKSLIINDHDKDRPAIGFTLAQHCGKAARGLRDADQARHFDSCRKPGFVQASAAQAEMPAA